VSALERHLLEVGVKEGVSPMTGEGAFHVVYHSSQTVYLEENDLQPSNYPLNTFDYY
jgi:hypothetical protein